MTHCMTTTASVVHVLQDCCCHQLLLLPVCQRQAVGGVATVLISVTAAMQPNTSAGSTDHASKLNSRSALSPELAALAMKEDPTDAELDAELQARKTVNNRSLARSFGFKSRQSDAKAGEHAHHDTQVVIQLKAANSKGLLHIEEAAQAAIAAVPNH
eukprot:jgi/Chrzof1/7403/Cz02g22010.t1